MKVSATLTGVQCFICAGQFPQIFAQWRTPTFAARKLIDCIVNTYRIKITQNAQEMLFGDSSSFNLI